MIALGEKSTPYNFSKGWYISTRGKIVLPTAHPISNSLAGFSSDAILFSLNSSGSLSKNSLSI